MVEFLDNEDTFDSAEAADRLSQMIDLVASMNQTVRDMDHTVHSSREYLSKVMGVERKGGYGGGIGVGMGMFMQGGMLDEDMMGDEMELRPGGFMTHSMGVSVAGGGETSSCGSPRPNLLFLTTEMSKWYATAVEHKEPPVDLTRLQQLEKDAEQLCQEFEAETERTKAVLEVERREKAE
ncbi:hypothetical protein HDU93_006789, partial [Gonapodya sp. JEL0774]